MCWEPVEDCDADCAKIHEAVTDKETDDFLIRIDPIYRTSLKVAKMTLLHEMVHIKLWPPCLPWGALSTRDDAAGSGGGIPAIVVKSISDKKREDQTAKPFWAGFFFVLGPGRGFWFDYYEKVRT